MIYDEGANLFTIVFDWLIQYQKLINFSQLLRVFEDNEMGFTNTDGFRDWCDKIIREVWDVKKEVSYTPLLRFKYLRS